MNGLTYTAFEYLVCLAAVLVVGMVLFACTAIVLVATAAARVLTEELDRIVSPIFTNLGSASKNKREQVSNTVHPPYELFGGQRSLSRFAGK
jgi:hypothetical protein